MFTHPGLVPRGAPLPERPAAQGAATGLCLVQSMPACSPAFPNAEPFAPDKAARRDASPYRAADASPKHVELYQNLRRQGRGNVANVEMWKCGNMEMWKCCQFQCCQLPTGTACPPHPSGTPDALTPKPQCATIASRISTIFGIIATAVFQVGPG